MGGREAKTSKASGPNGSEADEQAAAAGREGEAQQPDAEEVARLRAANERMTSQVEALKEELNKEIERSAVLQTEVARRQQTAVLAITAAAVAAAAALAALLYRRRR